MTRRLASVRVFLTNPVTKRCQRCRAMNFPFGRNQTKPNNNNNNNNNKTCREKEDGKLITAATNNYVQFSSNISLNSRYKPSSTSFKRYLLTDVTGKYFKDLKLINFPLNVQEILLSHASLVIRSTPRGGGGHHTPHQPCVYPGMNTRIRMVEPVPSE